MADIEFSQGVVEGLRMLGHSHDDIARLAATTPAIIESIVAGHEPLSDAELDSIEENSGKTGGQLAALSLEPDGGPLTEITDVVAKLHHSLKPPTVQSPR